MVVMRLQKFRMNPWLIVYFIKDLIYLSATCTLETETNLSPKFLVMTNLSLRFLEAAVANAFAFK